MERRFCDLDIYQGLSESVIFWFKLIDCVNKMRDDMRFKFLLFMLWIKGCDFRMYMEVR